MSKARDIADNNASALITGTLAAARLPSTGVDASSLSAGTLPIARLGSGTITADKFAANAVSDSTIGTEFTQKFYYTNVSPNQQPINASFTLSAAEAPLGSFVMMATETLSGSSAGDQYCYLYQDGGTGIRAGTYVGNDWYYYDMTCTLYPIIDSGDRTFNVSHGTIAYSTSGDIRRVAYCGYMKIDGLGD